MNRKNQEENAGKEMTNAKVQINVKCQSQILKKLFVT
jgi:hypothetical protein